MKNFMQFDFAVKQAFDNNEENYMNFNKLLLDTYNNELEGVTAKQANEKIREMFFKVIGCDAKSSKVEIRKGIRRNQIAIYELIEEVIDNALVSGWQSNPFFMEYVDVRNLALGDKNEFYTPDNSVLSVMKVSGNHHDIF